MSCPPPTPGRASWAIVARKQARKPPCDRSNPSWAASVGGGPSANGLKWLPHPAQEPSDWSSSLEATKCDSNLPTPPQRPASRAGPKFSSNVIQKVPGNLPSNPDLCLDSTKTEAGEERLVYALTLCNSESF